MGEINHHVLHNVPDESYFREVLQPDGHLNHSSRPQEHLARNVFVERGCYGSAHYRIVGRQCRKYFEMIKRRLNTLAFQREDGWKRKRHSF